MVLRNLIKRVTTAQPTLSPHGSGAAKRKPARGGRPVFEPLEPRLMLDGESLLITEFMSLNTAGLTDEDGLRADWIEIHNPTAGSINLDGWYLTDKDDNLTKWAFPDVPIHSGDYLLVFATEKDRTTGELHANFRLNDSGEYLALVQEVGATIEVASEYWPEFPTQYANVSYGLSPDFSTRGYFTTPTPRFANVGEPIDDPIHQVVINEIMYHPASENVLEEYIELFNRGMEPVNLAGWQFTAGVSLEIPDVPEATIAPGEYLLIVADETTFQSVYSVPEGTGVIGNWEGRLSNRSEAIELINSDGQRVDRVQYADEGDWATREEGPDDIGHTGWIWAADHDGGGQSLELINPVLSNKYGQNWASSSVDVGPSPGQPNSVAAEDIAPMILDVSHFPVIPRRSDPVSVTARLKDESGIGQTATVYYRVDGEPDFTTLSMFDDGTHGDGHADDGVYGAVIPAAEHLSPGDPARLIVEFYVEATDQGGLERTWPAPTRFCPAPDEVEYGQLTNLLYQVDDDFDPSSQWNPEDQPVYRVIMTEAERYELENEIGDGVDGAHLSNAQMNATFISVDGVNTELRYNVGIRNRGNGSRRNNPNNHHINFPHDRPWQEVTAINVNARSTYFQHLGMTLFRVAGLPAEDSRAVQIRVNGRNLASSGSSMYGSYVHLQTYDSDFAEKQFPDDGGGNVYKCIVRGHSARLDYLGTNPQAYINAGYAKSTNASENDWSDLIRLTDVLNNAPYETYAEEVATVLDVDQWMKWLAMHALFANGETNLGTGRGDDYSMYCGVNDPRFVLLPHDLDTILGRGGMTGVTNSIYQATALPAMERFLTHPALAPRYHAALIELIKTVFSPEQFDTLADQTLGSYVPQATIDTMKQFVVARNANVLSQIEQSLTISSSLPVVDGYPCTTESDVDLSGTAHAAYANSVLVGGQEADWDPFSGEWAIGGFTGGEVEILVPQESIWSYLDDGSDQGTAWRELDFEPDPPWAEGQAELGYGDAPGVPENTVVNSGPPNDYHITTYFRHEFEVEDASAYTGLTARLRRDDGAVVYLNGEEAFRSNMREGDVTYQTRAQSNIYGGNSETVFHEYPVDLKMLANGRNVVAVEVHQYLPTSADISFDLQLDAFLPSDVPGTQLNAGINRVFVDALDGFDGTGNRLQHDFIDVWYDDGSETTWSGPITDQSTVWDAASGPWHVTGDVTVPVGTTLTIEPGTTVFFDQDTRMIVEGRLVAEGAPYERIRFTREPGSAATWGGLFFNSAEDNRLARLDMEYSSAAGQSIDLTDSRLMIDDVTWDGTDRTILRIADSSLIVRNSVFPDTIEQAVSGSGLLASDPYLLFEGNVFGVCTGEQQDVVHFSVGDAGLSAQFMGNVFLGGGDEALDLDSANAYIEGNVFQDFHKNFDPGNTGEDGQSHAIAVGDDAGLNPEHTIVRNVFVDCDHAVLIEDQSFAIFENNTVVGCTSGLNFHEPLRTEPAVPGRGAYLDGNIFHDTPVVWSNLLVGDPVWGTTDVALHRSIVPVEYHVYGVGNLDEDPRLADPTGGDFDLLPGSPALGAGPNGIDMGATAPGGAWLSGRPPALTARSDATLFVSGPGVTHYRYRLDGDPVWSTAAAVDAPIELTGLADGDHALQVIGRNAAGTWQDAADAAVATWRIDSSLKPVRINEVLAVNVSAFEHHGGFPDLIELVNDGPLPVDLAGMSISDDEGVPLKFVFPDDAPAETTIPAFGHLLLYADDQTEAPGLHLGFSLDGDGEGVFLFDAPAQGGAKLDEVRFGLQVPDLSIGRLGHQQTWELTEPTPAAANEPARTGDPATLKINEWLADGDVLFDDDFIELYNPDPLPVALAGLFLTDDHVARPWRHEIAPLSFIAGSGFAVFTADGDSEKGPSHLAFRLAPEQELLGLYDPNLREIDKVVYYPQTTDVSQGRSPDGAGEYAFLELPTPGVRYPVETQGETRDVVLVAENADKRVLVPTEDIGESWRSDVHYADTEWILGTGDPGGVGYDRGTGYQGFITVDTEAEMYGGDNNNTCYVRIPFTVDAEDLADLTNLTLKMRYDDGMRVYLNGDEVTEARRNFDDPPEWDAHATGGHEASRTDFDFALDISDYIEVLDAGDNLLAIHAANDENTSSDFLTSARLEAVVDVAPPDENWVTDAIALLRGLRITEIMYNPEGDGDAEFIELKNVGATTLDLTGIRFSQGVDFSFPPMLLAPGQHTVVVRDRETFESCYGPGVNVAGEYADNLSDGGEELVLQLAAPLEAAVMRFEYNDTWYPQTDGAGFALEIVEPGGKAASWDEERSWRASSTEGGTPGWDGGTSENPHVDIVINEVLTHTDPPLSDTIELYNTTDAPIDIGGWYLSDSDDNYLKFRIPDGTTIGAGEYVVFTEDDFNPAPLIPGPNDFALDGAHGDDVFLVQAVDGKVTRVVDYVVFGAAANGESFGRWPNGQGSVYPMVERTLDPAHGENAGPRLASVVISEVHHNPGEFFGADNLEFIEIFNAGSQDVNLTNWRLRKGIDFDFPTDTLLPTGSALVVVSFDSGDGEKLSAFQDRYGIDASVQILGPYSGQLGNGGEKVQLQRPDEPPVNEPDFFPHLLEDEVVYDNQLPWPVQADGSGSSLNRTPELGWGNDVGSWYAVPPNPGSVDAVLPPLVIGRQVFYNGSAHDGHDPSAGAEDDLAIATDKQALLPGRTATFANYTSYDRGINGIMVDIHALPEGAVPDADDFEFRVGNDSNPDSWSVPADPKSVSVRRGAGIDGSSRVTLIWDDYTVVNQWLEVTVLSTADTGLRARDVFYFGNAVAESGNSTADARVNAADVLLARSNPRSFLNPAPVDFALDYNRDGRVNATDLLIARSNQTHLLNALQLISVPHLKTARTDGTPIVDDEARTTNDEPAEASHAIATDWLLAIDAMRAGTSDNDRSADETQPAADPFWLLD